MSSRKGNLYVSSRFISVLNYSSWLYVARLYTGIKISLAIRILRKSISFDKSASKKSERWNRTVSYVFTNPIPNSIDSVRTILDENNRLIQFS